MEDISQHSGGGGSIDGGTIASASHGNPSMVRERLANAVMVNKFVRQHDDLVLRCGPVFAAHHVRNATATLQVLAKQRSKVLQQHLALGASSVLDEASATQAAMASLASIPRQQTTNVATAAVQAAAATALPSQPTLLMHIVLPTPVGIPGVAAASAANMGLSTATTASAATTNLDLAAANPAAAPDTSQNSSSSRQMIIKHPNGLLEIVEHMPSNPNPTVTLIQQQEQQRLNLQQALASGLITPAQAANLLQSQQLPPQSGPGHQRSTTSSLGSQEGSTLDRSGGRAKRRQAESEYMAPDSSSGESEDEIVYVGTTSTSAATGAAVLESSATATGNKKRRRSSASLARDPLLGSRKRIDGSPEQPDRQKRRTLSPDTAKRATIPPLQAFPPVDDADWENCVSRTLLGQAGYSLDQICPGTHVTWTKDHLRVVRQCLMSTHRTIGEGGGSRTGGYYEQEPHQESTRERELEKQVTRLRKTVARLSAKKESQVPFADSTGNAVSESVLAKELSKQRERLRVEHEEEKKEWLQKLKKERNKNDKELKACKTEYELALRSYMKSALHSLQRLRQKKE